MPELPEVETIRRGIEPFLDRQVIKAVTINRTDLRFPVPASTRQDIQGQNVVSLKRHGKYLQIQLGNDKTIIWHMGMSGSVRVYHQQTEPYEPQKHDHIIIESNAPAKIVFNDPRRFGFFYCIDNLESFSNMGPDAVSCTAQELYDALKTKKSPIKTALLDQSVIAGCGNIYVCEALYRAGISPMRLACDIKKSEATILMSAIHDILAIAIEKGGSSLKDHRLTDGSMGYFQNFFDVYGRKGLPCPQCACNNENKDEGCILQIKQAGRSTFYCPVRQK